MSNVLLQFSKKFKLNLVKNNLKNTLEKYGLFLVEFNSLYSYIT